MGELLLYDIASSSLIETIKAHEGAVWSMHMRSNKMGLVTGSADKEVKFWDLDYTQSKDTENSVRWRSYSKVSLLIFNVFRTKK